MHRASLIESPSRTRSTSFPPPRSASCPPPRLVTTGAIRILYRLPMLYRPPSNMDRSCARQDRAADRLGEERVRGGDTSKRGRFEPIPLKVIKIDDGPVCLIDGLLPI